MEQPATIGNIDEICLTLDGRKCIKGGRPVTTFILPIYPTLAKPQLKLSWLTQFLTIAQSKDTQCVKIRMTTSVLELEIKLYLILERVASDISNEFQRWNG